MTSVQNRRQDFVMVKSIPLTEHLNRILTRQRHRLRKLTSSLHAPSIKLSQAQKTILSFHSLLLIWVAAITLFTKPGQYWERYAALVLSLIFFYLSMTIILDIMKGSRGKGSGSVPTSHPPSMRQ